MQQITKQQLKAMLQSGEAPYLIDVREPEERQAFHIGGVHIPLGEVVNHVEDIPTDQPVIFYCRKGIRSQIAIQRLSSRQAFPNLINLQGGILHWQDDDPE